MHVHFDLRTCILLHKSVSIARQLTFFSFEQRKIKWVPSWPPLDSECSASFIHHHNWDVASQLSPSPHLELPQVSPDMLTFHNESQNGIISNNNFSTSYYCGTVGQSGDFSWNIYNGSVLYKGAKWTYIASVIRFNAYNNFI